MELDPAPLKAPGVTDAKGVGTRGGKRKGKRGRKVNPFKMSGCVSFPPACRCRLMNTDAALTLI